VGRRRRWGTNKLVSVSRDIQSSEAGTRLGAIGNGDYAEADYWFHILHRSVCDRCIGADYSNERQQPKTETHKTMGGKVNIYRRENSDNWQCSTFLNGRNWRVFTHEDSLGRAKDFAEDWYLALRGKAHAGLLAKETRREGKKFKDAAEKFLEEAPILTQGQRGPTWLNQ